MIKKPVLKNILTALIMAIVGFILLNATFLFDWLFQSTIKGLISFFSPINHEDVRVWFFPLMHILFVIVIGLISWPILKSKLAPVYKATYLMVPTAVVFVTIGMFLYRWPIFSYSLGILIGFITLYYFKRFKLSWMYYYSVILVGIVLMIMTLSGTDI